MFVGCSCGLLALRDLTSDLTVSTHVSMALLALAALLGVQAEDTACLLQSHKSQAIRETECSQGVETYDFSQWDAKLYTTDEGLQQTGILITNYRERECQQPAIFNSQVGPNSDSPVKACNCNALIMAADGSEEDDMDVCTSLDQAPWIDLTFTEPQTILEVEFFNMVVSDTQAASVKYWVTDGSSKTARLNDPQGEGVASPLVLSGLTDPAPVDIEKIRLLSVIIVGTSFSAPLRKRLVKSSQIPCSLSGSGSVSLEPSRP